MDGMKGYDCVWKVMFVGEVRLEDADGGEMEWSGTVAV